MVSLELRVDLPPHVKIKAGRFGDVNTERECFMAEAYCDGLRHMHV